MSFRIGGIRFDISFYFFALLTAFFILEPDNVTACGALSAILHEAGHLAAMLLVPDASVERVTISACGLRITARMSGQHRGWVPVCFAGAAANFAVSALLLPAALLSGNNFVSVLFSANVCIGVLNLLPVEPMDGGQLLRAFTLRITSPEKADRICLIVSLITLIPLIGAGLWILMRTRFNFSLLLLGLWLLGGVLEQYIG